VHESKFLYNWVTAVCFLVYMLFQER
jgi:hypothetical protein